MTKLKSSDGKWLQTHGHAKRVTPEYRAWGGMKKRCKSTWHKHRLYFDRGIHVCPKWLVSFDAFLAEVGSRPSPKHQIDRIDNNRGYEPGNVRWADLSTQRRNQRPRGKGYNKTRSDKGTKRPRRAS